MGHRKAATPTTLWQRIWHAAKPVLTLLGSVVLLGFVLSNVDWAVLRGSLRMMAPPVLALAFVLLLFNDFFLCLKCFYLQPDLPFWRIYCAFLNMRFFSLLPGGNTTGEAARLMALREMTGMQTATAIIILDKQTHLIPAQTYCLIGLLFATVRVPVPLIGLSALSFAWPLLIPGLLFIPRVRKWAMAAGKRMQRRKLGRLLDVQVGRLCGLCESLAKHPRQLVTHLLCGFVGEGFSIATLVLLSHQLQLPVPWWDWLWINSMMLTAMMIPLSTMGIGMREGAMVLLLSLYGIASSRAMSLALTLSALMLVKGLVGGAVAMLHRRTRMHTRDVRRERERR